MRQVINCILLTVLMSMVGVKAFAYDIAVENADGVTIYYNYSYDGTELIVTRGSYSGSIVIPEEVTYMNRTRKVTSIGNDAFNYCPDLTYVTIPNSVKTIGNEAFLDCHRLHSVTIPNSVTSIGDNAFAHCYSISSVIIPNSVTSIGKSAFYQCGTIISVTIGNSVTSIGKEAFFYCTGLTSLTIGNSVTSIGEKAFYYCSSLTSVNIPNSVTSIGKSAFSNCSSLNSVIIGNSVATIGEEAFYCCSNLTSVTIPNSVTSIGSWAFEGCNGLTSVIIGNSVTTIGEEAFYKCSNLTSVTIPNSVTSIGSRAFEGCNLHIVISLIVNPFDIDSPFSKNTYNNATLYVPVGTIDKYKSTKGWKGFLFIEEGTGPNGGDTSQKEKCATPTIGYQNGKLIFNCNTEGATCQYSITDDDIKSGSSNEVLLGVTYHISVYATKYGYENSETATATLCWIDIEPKTEGITNSVASVRARAVLIQSNGNQLTIFGTDEGTSINVYDISGRPAGSAKASAETTTINTSLCSGDIGIVKIGEKTVKVLIK